MTSTETFQQTYQACVRALDAQNLLAAIHCAAPLLEGKNAKDLRSEWEDTHRSYRSLLNNVRQGKADPQRESLRRLFIRRTYELADKARRLLNRQTKETLYATESLKYDTGDTTVICQALEHLAGNTAARRKSLKKGVATKAEKSAYEDLQAYYIATCQTFFDVLWTSPHLTGGQQKELQSFFASAAFDATDKEMAVGALFLSLLEYLDDRKVLLLIELCAQTEARQLSVQALVSLVLVLLVYQKRLYAYPEIETAFAALARRPEIAPLVLFLQKQLVLTLETKRVNELMRQESFPALKQGGKSISSAINKGHLGELMGKLEEIEKEQTEDMEKAERKIQELMAMEKRGVDIYYTSFSCLKGMKFFKPVTNWFYPFDEANPVIAAHLERMLPVFREFLRVGPLCDSDRYSFCITFSQASGEIGQTLMEMFNIEEREGVSTEEVLAALKRKELSAEKRITNCVHNLYRFFHLFPRRKEFLNPFEQDLLFIDVPLLSPFFTEAESLRQTAQEVFLGKHYATADKLISRLATIEPLSASEYEMQGFCAQSNGNYQQATDLYQKADLLESDNVWTLKHLAGCYRLAGNTEKALETYDRLERVAPDDLKALYQYASCLVLAKRYDEALARFFKLEYLSEGSTQAMRAIALSSFLSQKKEQAERYCRRLLAGKPRPEDYFTAGHVAWTAGDVQTAVSRYTKAKERFADKQSIEIFFQNDTPHLVAYGIHPEDIRLMIDALCDKP